MTNQLKELIEENTKAALKQTLRSHGITTEKPKPIIENSAAKLVSVTKVVSKTLRESFTIVPRSFVNKSEKLSDRTKEGHQSLYKKYVEAFNKLSISAAAADTEGAASTSSTYRSIKVDETFNLNAIKLHELYFSNISDLASEIAVDSLAYMRLSRDFGTFENWQFDFMACALSARSGWAMIVFEPYRNCYMNVVVDGHETGIPLGSVPVLVLDMWDHAYFKDYLDDKKSYIISMMREFNWNVVEARMMVAEKTELSAIYQIQPMVNTEPESMLSAAQQAGGQAPIVNVEPSAAAPTGHAGALSPSTPPAPALQGLGGQAR